MTAVGTKNYLNSAQLKGVHQAASVSEELVSNWFQLTPSSWKKYRYDIRTLKDLRPEETAPDVFAQILRYQRPAPPDGLRMGDFYSICLQDHNILAAINREPGLRLYPLMVYVVTHELVHLVRFYKFFQHFDAYEEQRDAEEVLVHQLTYDIIKPAKLEHMPEIFDFYLEHRNAVRDVMPVDNLSV